MDFCDLREGFQDDLFSMKMEDPRSLKEILIDKMSDEPKKVEWGGNRLEFSKKNIESIEYPEIVVFQGNDPYRGSRFKMTVCFGLAPDRNSMKLNMNDDSCVKTQITNTIFEFKHKKTKMLGYCEMQADGTLKQLPAPKMMKAPFGNDYQRFRVTDDIIARRYRFEPNIRYYQRQANGKFHRIN